ncbi:MAG: hypothetical protein V1913_01320 [Fibrobacterota bacterium]
MREKKAVKKRNEKKVSLVLDEFIAKIPARALEIYKTRIQSGIPGDELSDWLQAEKEIIARFYIKA